MSERSRPPTTGVVQVQYQAGCAVEYSADLSDEVTAALFAQRFVHFVEDLAHEPDRSLASL